MYENRRLRGQQRDKLFREALRLQLAEAGEDLKALREIADVLIGEAKAGNLAAIKEIADRMDGKPTQVLEHAGDSQPMLRFVRQIVHVDKTREELEDALTVEYTEELEEALKIDNNGHDRT